MISLAFARFQVGFGVGGGGSNTGPRITMEEHGDIEVGTVMVITTPGPSEI